MSGFNALWLPGTDHAGIATQNVVERELRKQNITRQQLGREKFIERVWQWKNQYGSRIVEQMKRLGDSCDWSRHVFTMDENVSRAVRKVFVTLYQSPRHAVVAWAWSGQVVVGTYYLVKQGDDWLLDGVSCYEGVGVRAYAPIEDAGK